MRNKNRINQKRIVYAILAVILLVACGIGIYHYFDQNNKGSGNRQSQSNTSLKPATDEEKNAGSQAKSSTMNTTDTSSNSSKNSNPSTPTQSTSSVDVQTTASSQNGTTYQLRYLISAVTNDTTCTLTLSNGQTTVTKTAKTQALAQSSTCQGFDIPTSELSPGTWQTTMTVSGGGITGTTASTIKVQ